MGHGATAICRPPAAQQSWHRDVTPRDRNGQPKRRTNWNEKVRVLDPSAPAEITERRLARFTDLFAFRWSDGIITRVGEGPRAWTKLRGQLCAEHVVRHLLADQIPTLQPQWVGARSLSTSRYCCLDVDADRSPEQQLSDDYDLTKADEQDRAMLLARQRPQPNKPSYEARCQTVEASLRRLGINPANPRQVLIQITPSGGRHYYIFFDQSYFLDQYQALLRDAGLRFAKGQIEFFPSTSHGLRLPFGHLPNRHRDPRAWIRFIDDYHQRRIKRHSLEKLYENLDTWRANRRTNQHATTTINSASVPTVTNYHPTPAAHNGAPRRNQTATAAITHQPTNNTAPAISRGDSLKPKSVAEAKQLLEQGIQQPGTRTEILKHLAASLIFIQGQSAEKAAETLITWAMHPRHKSQDIQHDLATGGDVVPKQIRRMCHWYEEHRDPTRNPTHLKNSTNQATNQATAHYAAAELAAIEPHLQSLPADERSHMAMFYLQFLAFAKRHGTVAPNNAGRDSSPAVKEVIRKWPGCHHMNYKQRIDAATKNSGLLRMTKDKWQNPNGKGRARTYRLAVPIVSADQWVVDYDTALARLTSGSFGATGVETEPDATQNAPVATFKKETDDERTHCENSKRERQRRSPDEQHRDGTHPTPVRPPRARGHLAKAARQRQPSPPETWSLRRATPASCRSNQRLVPLGLRVDHKQRTIAQNFPVGKATSHFRSEIADQQPRHSCPDLIARARGDPFFSESDIEIERFRATEYETSAESMTPNVHSVKEGTAFD